MPPPTNGPASMFLQHINEYLSILPLITVTILVLSVSLGLIDFVLGIFDSRQLVTWLDLSYPSIRHSFQGQLVLACQAVSIDMGIYKYILYQHHLLVRSPKADLFSAFRSSVSNTHIPIGDSIPFTSSH